MPKRGSEDNMEFIAKRLKKLEKRMKRSRRRKREPNTPPSSSSSSSSSTSSSSSSRNTSPERNYTHGRDLLMRAIEHGQHDDLRNTTQHPDISMSPPRAEAPQNTAVPPPRPTNSLPADPAVFAMSASPTTVLASSEGQTAIPTENTEEYTCPADLLEILGTDPTLTQEFGPDINKEVATRLEYLATSGLDKEVRKELLDKYLVPSNTKHVAAPQLNAEIKAALSELVVKRDRAIEIRQKQIAAAITSVSQIMSTQINVKEKDNNLLKQLMDTARILCDIQYGESVARRNFITYSLKKDMRDQLLGTKIDKYLFGVDLPETLKAAKAVSKSVIDLKEAPKKVKPPISTNTASKNLNWRAGPSVRKQQTGPPHRQQPAASSNQQRARASNRSSHRHKQTRRR